MEHHAVPPCKALLVMLIVNGSLSLANSDGGGRSAVTQHLGDGGDGIPVPRRDWNSKEPIERAKVADDLHVAPVHAEDEPAVPRENLQQPLAAGWKAHGHR